MSVTSTWTARLQYFDRISKTWKKPTFLTVTAARMRTAARKATQFVASLTWKLALSPLSSGDRDLRNRLRCAALTGEIGDSPRIQKFLGLSPNSPCRPLGAPEVFHHPVGGKSDSASEELGTVPKFSFKHCLEAPLKDCFHLIQVNRSSQQFAQGSDGTIQDSTRMNELEVTQIGIDV